MNPILQDFTLDLQRLRRMFEFSIQFGKFPAVPFDPDAIQNDALKDAVGNLHNLARQSHGDIPILNGVLLLYLGGRFENFVRELFEDLCDSLATQFTDFAHLPKAMREQLDPFHRRRHRKPSQVRACRQWGYSVHQNAIRQSLWRAALECQQQVPFDHKREHVARHSQ